MAIFVPFALSSKFVQVENKQLGVRESWRDINKAVEGNFCACECVCHVVFGWLEVEKPKFADKKHFSPNEPISSLTSIEIREIS
jgi:hypothetical protein